MRWRLFVSIFTFSIGALILVIIGLISGVAVFNTYALGVISVGLGVNSLIITLHTDRRIAEINGTMSRIETTQVEIRKAMEEQPRSNKPILATLQGLSQYYLHYISKQQKKNNKVENT